MQCEQVLEAVKLGEESQEIWDHLAGCVSCRTRCESTAFVFDRADATDKRAPAPILDARRRWLPFMLLFLLIPAVAGLALVAVKLRHAPEVAPPPVVVAPVVRPSVTPVAIPIAPPGPATRHVAIDATPEAVVWLDGKKQGPTPFAAELPEGKVLLELRADGYRSVHKSVQIADTELKLAFNLQPKSGSGSADPGEIAAPEPPRALPKPPSEKRAAPPPTHEEDDEPKVAAKPDPPEPRAKAAPATDDDDALPLMSGGGFGFLTINCEPFAKVIIDGKDIGHTTPLSRYSTPPGHHTVELRARNGSVTVEVNVKPRQSVEIDKTIE